MTIKLRKKGTRHRGSHTHGWGAKKKHRGAGSRGGRGRAGTGKRGDAKKPVIWGNKKYFGKHGFKNNANKKIKAINICDIEQKLDKLLNKKLITKENDVFIIDLNKLGYNKLLSKGTVINKLKITTVFSSKKAVEKIKQKGGEVILPTKQK